MQKSSLLIVCAALLAVNVALVDGKRSFSIGRSRKKAPNINVRRKGTIPDVKPPVASGPGSSGFDAPPSYASVARGNPPSYAEATRGANYPRQTYSSNVGNFPHRESNSPATYGLGSPNQGLFTGPHTAGSGGMMGTGDYGRNYGYGSSSPFGVGHVLTGLTLWNLGRSFNSHGHTQHVYIERNRDQEMGGVVSPPHNTDIVVEHPLLTTISPRSEEIPPFVVPSSETSATHQPNVEYITEHPSLLIYAINTIPIRTEVVMADKTSFV